MKTIEPTEPDLDTMKRADLPAIWTDFREKVEALKTTAETLTVTDESDKAGMKLARQTRLNLREIRIAVENRRKELGEEALRRKQGIDSDAKQIKDLCDSLESRLLDCEQFAERAEAARAAAKLTERTAAIIAAKGSPEIYNLAGCTEEAFAAIIESLDVAEKARIAAKEKAEADRLAAIAAAEAEKERIRLENIRLAAEAAKLRAEAEEREKAAKAERDAAAAALAKVQAEAEADRKKQAEIEAEKLRVEREKAAAEAAKAKAEAEAENARLAGIAEEQRQIAAKAQAEIERAKAAATKVAADEKRAAAKAAAAPDAEKLTALATAIRGIERPALSTNDAFAIRDAIFDELEEVAAKLEARIGTL